jgi:hypothetical protein
MKTILQSKTKLAAMIMLFSAMALSAQVDHFQLGFGNSLPAGWTGEGIFMTSTASNRNTTYENTFGGTHAIKMLIPCVVTTKGYYTAGTLSFWIYEKNAGDGYVKVEKSTDAGVTWVEIDSIALNSAVEVPYTQFTYEINDDSPSVHFRFSSGLKEFYMDDLSLTSLAPENDNAYLFNLGVNGQFLSEFETTTMEYAADLTYPIATIDAVTFHPEATVQIDYPSPEEYFGTEEERTASVTVTAKDGTTTENYEILFNVTGYHIEFGFPSTGGNIAANGWEAKHTYVTSSENNGLYDGDNALRFTRDSGYVHTIKYYGVDTVSFFTKVGMNDGSAMEPGETLNVSAKGGSDIFWTDLGTFTTGTEITDQWQEVELILDMASETDSVEVRWFVRIANSQTRIYLEDIGISGHPTYLDPSFYTDVENKLVRKNQLNVYPNPASEIVNIQLPENLTQGRLSVYNITGQEVISLKITESTQQVSVTELPKGIYIISLSAGSEKYLDKLLVK